LLNIEATVATDKAAGAPAELGELLPKIVDPPIFANLPRVNAASSIVIVIVLSAEAFAVKVGVALTETPPLPAKVKVLLYTVGISLVVAKIPAVGRVKVVLPVVSKDKEKFPAVVKLFAKKIALPFIKILPVPLDIKFKLIFASSPVAEIEGETVVAALLIVNSFTALVTVSKMTTSFPLESAIKPNHFI
jgi:hypothetical protein